MLIKFKTSLYFPFFTLRISANDKKISNLIVRQFPVTYLRPCKFLSIKPLSIKLHYYRTKYSLLPRSRHDCFHGFTLFHNQFIESKCFHLDSGPRTLRTVVNPQTNTISSFMATPVDIERDLLFDLIFFHPLKCLLEINDMFLFHASLVVKNNQGVLFSGKSGSGKSVVSLTLARNGYDYLSDDEIVLHQEKSGVRCSAFPSLPKVKRNLLSMFPEFKKFSLKPSTKKDKSLVDITKIFPLTVKGAVKPALLIFPKYSRSSKVKLKPLDKKKTLQRLVREEFMYLKPSSKHVSGERFKILLSLLDQVKVYQLFYNDDCIDDISSVVSNLIK